MKVSSKNYYSERVNLEYFSASQFKDFLKCEEGAVAKVNGYEKAEPSRALLLGQFVDTYFTESKKTYLTWCTDHKDELFKKSKKDELYADVEQARDTIRRILEQPLMMKYLSGDHQKIMTGEIEGVRVKIKMDSYKEHEFIADLKYMKSLRSPNLFDNLIKYWGYNYQAAIYREIVRQNTGETLPFYFVIATKEEPAHLAVAEISSEDMDEALDIVKANIKHFDDVKKGRVMPTRCGRYDCDHCAKTVVLTAPVDISMLGTNENEREI